MDKKYYDEFKNIIPEIKNCVHRICTPRWKLNGLCGDYNFILIYEGRAYFEQNGKVFEGKKGDLILFSPGLERRGYTYKNDLMKCYAIDFSYICPIINKNTEEWEFCHTKLPFDLGQKLEDEHLFLHLKKIMSDIHNSWLSNKPYKNLKMRELFLELLTQLLIWKSQQGINYYNLHKVSKVIDYMSEHYYQRLTLNDLASLVNISVSYLGSIFKEATQKTPIEYLMDIRIAKAKQLLEDGYRISECAEQTGFYDIYYFSKYFKKHEGITPTMYINERI